MIVSHFTTLLPLSSPYEFSIMSETRCPKPWSPNVYDPENLVHLRVAEGPVFCSFECAQTLNPQPTQIRSPKPYTRIWRSRTLQNSEPETRATQYADWQARGPNPPPPPKRERKKQNQSLYCLNPQKTANPTLHPKPHFETLSPKQL